MCTNVSLKYVWLALHPVSTANWKFNLLYNHVFYTMWTVSGYMISMHTTISIHCYTDSPVIPPHACGTAYSIFGYGLCLTQCLLRSQIYILRADSRFAPSQWETVLLCNDISHWLGASLKWALILTEMWCWKWNHEWTAFWHYWYQDMCWIS